MTKKKNDNSIKAMFTFRNFLRGIFVSVLGGISTVIAMLPVALLILIVSLATGNPFMQIYANYSMIALGLSGLLSFSIFGWLIMKFINTIKGI